MDCTAQSYMALHKRHVGSPKMIIWRYSLSLRPNYFSIGQQRLLFFDCIVLFANPGQSEQCAIAAVCILYLHVLQANCATLKLIMAISPSCCKMTCIKQLPVWNSNKKMLVLWQPHCHCSITPSFASQYSPKVSAWIVHSPYNNKWIYSESYTPFGRKMQSQNEFHLQSNSLFTRNPHWTRGVTLNSCKTGWATTWTWMNPDCNWNDLFMVKSSSNFYSARGCLSSNIRCLHFVKEHARFYGASSELYNPFPPQQHIPSSWLP